MEGFGPPFILLGDKEMDYTVRKVEVDLIALEGHLASLDAVRAELGERKITQGLALECDALMHNYRGQQGSLISLRYNHNATSRDYTVALEGIISTVWEHIKMIFAKIVEYVKKFWAWITAKSNQNTPQKAEQAEQSSEEFRDVWDEIMSKYTNMDASVTTYDAEGKATTKSYKDGAPISTTEKQTEATRGESAPQDPHEAHKNFKHIDQLDVKYGKDSNLLKGDNDATNPDAPPEKTSHSFRNGKWVEDAKPAGSKSDPFKEMTAEVNKTNQNVAEHVKNAHAVNDILNGLNPSSQDDKLVQATGEYAHASGKEAKELHEHTQTLNKPHDAVKPLDIQKFKSELPGAKTSIKVTPTGKTGNPGVDAATHRTRDTMREVDEQNKKVNDLLKDHPSQNGDVTMQRAGEHLLQKLESDLADTEGKIASIQSEIDGAKKAGQTGDAISKLESKKKWYQESADIQKDSVEKFRKQIEAHHSKPATEGISLEDAGMRAQKPAEIFNTVALSMKSQFLSGLPRPETLILFSPNYAAELEKLAREFARLKPIDALMKRYTAIDQWLGKAMGEAATIDAIKDINEYRPRLEDFRKSFEAEVNHIHETPDDAELLAGDITRFYASREDHGSNAFAIETPQTGDQLMHVARVTDTTFRAVRAVTAEIKDAGAELKRLENLFESLSTKINTASAGGTGNTGARDFVAHTLQSEVRLVSSKVRSIVQGLGVFTNYYSDAHRAVSRYQKFVIKVVEAALHEMKGDHEFQEEQIRSLLAKLRDANNAFDRIK